MDKSLNTQAQPKGPQLDQRGFPVGWIYSPAAAREKALAHPLGSQEHALGGADFLFIDAGFEAQS